MKRILTMLAAGSFIVAAGCDNGVAQEEEEVAVPVEIYACKYNDGQGPADLDRATARWNAWADDRGWSDYSAWTLTKFYAGPEQEFDVIWLGVSPNAKAMGRAQDDWLANGQAIAAEFEKVATCDIHANFAALQFKAPPGEEPPPSAVASFSDCTIADGKTFDDLAPALTEWADYRTGHGSTAGMWAFFPAYGGGGEEFDFKWVVTHRTHEEQGADWDAYAQGGYEKAGELFRGLLECDSARVYNTVNRRMAAAEE